MRSSSFHSGLLLLIVLSTELYGRTAARHRTGRARHAARNVSAVSAEEKPKVHEPSYRWVCNKLKLTREERQHCLETLGKVAVTNTRKRMRRNHRKRSSGRPVKMGHTYFAVNAATIATMDFCMANLMRHLDKLLKAHSIRYFLASGSLLGATRNGRRIPWDDDLDVRVVSADWPKLIPLLKDPATALPIVFDDRAQHLGTHADVQGHLWYKPCNELGGNQHRKETLHVDLVRSDYRVRWVWKDQSWVERDPESYPAAIAFEGLRVSAPTAKGAERLLRDEYGPGFLGAPDSDKAGIMEAYKDRTLPSLDDRDRSKLVDLGSEHRHQFLLEFP